MLEHWMKITADKEDDHEFIEIVNKIMAISIFQWHIDEIMNIKIKNWFDHKWLNYSGKTIVHFDFGGLEEFDERENSSLEDQWKEKITLPPFHPNRVLSEQYFRKRNTGNKQFEKVVHKLQRSTDNQQNYVARMTKNGLYVWYSSKSKINQRGALMMYRVQNEEVATWYASLEKRDHWIIAQTKGINKSNLEGMIK